MPNAQRPPIMIRKQGLNFGAPPNVAERRPKKTKSTISIATNTRILANRCLTNNEVSGMTEPNRKLIPEKKAAFDGLLKLSISIPSSSCM